MRLMTLTISASSEEMPENVLALCTAAEERAKWFIRERPGTKRIPEFQASNLHVAFRVLQSILDDNLAPGRSFCEWGSGLGGVTCIASMLGFSAHGIEIEPALVREARKLGREFDLPVDFHLGSYKPTRVYEGDLNMGDVSRELGFSPAAFDVIYAYPWPAEERVILELFETGSPGESILVTYLGGAKVRSYRRLPIVSP